MESSPSEITPASTRNIKKHDPNNVLEEWHQNFRELDANGDGKLSVEEVRRVVMVLMKHTGGNTASDGWREAAEMVSEADEDGDGYIDLEEFIELNRRMSIDNGRSRTLTTNSVNHVDVKFDANHAQGQYIVDQSEITSEDDKVLADAFEVFDANRDGRITAEELHAVLVELGGIGEGPKTFGANGTPSTSTSTSSGSSNTTSMQECRRMIRAVDRKGDGYVDFHDFKRMMSMIMP